MRRSRATLGITLFLVVATQSGADLVGGWNVAVLVSSGVTLLGGGAIALGARRPHCATNRA
jgi:hypothetical protein